MFNLHKYMANSGRLHTSGGKLRGSLGKLPKFPSTFLLGMCLLAHGYYVHCGLWRRVCKNHPGTTFHGLLHPWWFVLHPYDHTSNHHD
ncbi:unnamed protein product [Coregonus sp. 'balchen']|nr:unnamed protein product [Coregonus sp. 'balchen']